MIGAVLLFVITVLSTGKANSDPSDQAQSGAGLTDYIDISTLGQKSLQLRYDCPISEILCQKLDCGRF